ncbi:MAG: hypothetical protein AABZ31_05570, partial [Bdellovibrionota bacterium]
AAFKKGDAIQLGRNLNGRSSLNFKSSANNVSQVIKAGTIASVMDYRRLQSGNYGVQVRLDGLEYKDKPESERTVWIYDWKDRADDVKGCDDPACIQESISMEAAGWAKAIQDQPATVAAPEPVVPQAITKLSAGWGGAAIQTPAPRPPVQIIIKEKSSTAAVDSCNGWGCSGSTSTTPQIQIQEMVASLPTSRPEGEELEEDEAIPEDEAPSENRLAGASGLSFTGGKLLPKACHKWIDNQGNIGPMGEELIRLMLRSKYSVDMYERASGITKSKSVFLRDNVMGGICPNYSKLNDPQKMTAMVYMFAALAFKEGSCSTVNDHMALQRAYGAYSAEKSEAVRWKRGSDCRGDIRSTAVHISCAVDTIGSFGNQGLLDG